MFNRILNPLKSNSFFIFGARGTGKSTFIKTYLAKENAYLFDLLDDDTFDTLLTNPRVLEEKCRKKNYQWIILDEVQRIPKLLNLVHRMIEDEKQKFALTGSSSRKLRRGGANLLAGRAFINTLFPLTTSELGPQFKLNSILHWGSLPKIFQLSTNEERRAYLRSYCLTYIKEEIQAEQTVRKLEPFREFLTVSAQCSGKIINYSSIAREIGGHTPTIQNYFQILEDTHIGFLLPHYHRSVRKSQLQSPKFFYFDLGVKKALENSLESPPIEGTSHFGDLFESFIIQEIYRLNHYYEKDYRMSYLMTKNGAEIDLILSKGRKTIVVEIKSTQKIDLVEVRKLAKFREGFPAEGTTFYYISRDENELTEEDVLCIPWQKFLEQFIRS